MLLKDGKSIEVKETNSELIPYPAVDSGAFELSEHVTCVLFYGEQDTFAMNNSYFVSAWMDKDALILKYVHFEVRIEGRGLHTLFVKFSQFRVWKIMARAERYQKGESVFVSSIKRKKRTKKPAEEPEKENEDSP